uniref:Uncharacterized protein n=1 Tax=Rhizophora mucronata TaxID=61149 RepID=A0A2P2ITA9_RHIMU
MFSSYLAYRRIGNGIQSNEPTKLMKNRTELGSGYKHLREKERGGRREEEMKIKEILHT